MVKQQDITDELKFGDVVRYAGIIPYLHLIGDTPSTIFDLLPNEEFYTDFFSEEL